MANYLLKPIYEAIFETSFNPGDFEERMKMQKSIYLLQEMGVSVGEYDFKWYKHGPYSQKLQNDILDFSKLDIKVKFSSDAKVALEALKNAIYQNELAYSTSQWSECLGSIHYIKENLLPSSASEEDVLSELEKRKVHLNQHADNKKALKILESLFA